MQKEQKIFRAHGANPEKLYEAAGIPLPPSGKILDFSTNTNVLPWDGKLDIDLRSCMASYPDDEAAELRAITAAREGCGTDNVLFVNGSNEAIYLIASFLSGKKTAVLQPAYGEYIRALSAYGAEVRNVFSAVDLKEALINYSEAPPQIPLKELSPLRISFNQRLLKSNALKSHEFQSNELKNSDAVFLCNPCNPTGGCIGTAELHAFFAGAPDTLFVVDEAYVDFLTLETGARDKIDFLRHKNVVLLRSLTKIFHLCGTRLGYVLACRERIEKLRSRQPTWSVNALAQAAGAAFMKDEDFIRKTRSFYASETPRFIALLKEAGFTVRPTRTNFFLIEATDDLRLIRSLLERGVVVRHTRNFPGLNGKYIRVTTRLPEENDYFVRAMLDTEGRLRRND